MTPQAEALEDATLAHTDAELILAGITELRDFLANGNLNSAAVTDISRDVLPRLRAISNYLHEQIDEVTL